jgi:hypothetical protein
MHKRNHVYIYASHRVFVDGAIPFTSGFLEDNDGSLVTTARGIEVEAMTLDVHCVSPVSVAQMIMMQILQR